MSEKILVAVASGSEDLIPTLVEKLQAIRPDLPVYIVSEFKEQGGTWIPYRPGRTLEENFAAIRSALRGKQIVYTALILQPRMPYWNMRALAVKLGGLNTIFFNENLDHFMLRPRSAPVIARHLWWRTRNFVRWELKPGGATYTWLWRARHPSALKRPLLFRKLLALGAEIAARKRSLAPEALPPPKSFPPGISVVVPSRNGRDLLERLLPGVVTDLAATGGDSEIIVVDNGSDDGTVDWLSAQYPAVRVEYNAEPMSFARAVNRGLRAARYSHSMMLNNDMVIEPGFFGALRRAFDAVPNLFSATAEILFPAGVRRQETGKAVMPVNAGPGDFPITCIDPIRGEDHTYVFYGSGGCSLYDSAKLHQLGLLLEIYVPTYVEDLDIGWRGWQCGWPTVFVAGARVEHRHRSTTSRYYSQQDLDRIVEVNHLKFIAASVTSPPVFERMWRQSVARLNARAARVEGDPAAIGALQQAREAMAWVRPPVTANIDEPHILAIGSGDVAVFPGAGSPGKPSVLVASPYMPFPLSHGGAVRMYNLMKRAAADFDLTLLCFAEHLETPPEEVRALCREVVVVRRLGRHDLPLTARPDTVEEFDRPAFRAALKETMRKRKPALVQMEYTQMALYAPDCRPARTVLVEHDITFDLYEQLLRNREDWETRQQYERWVPFEKQAWRQVDAVVTMSEKDLRSVETPNVVALPNGVDLERFQPSPDEPQPRRILFIGAFSHLPNVLALDFFLREAWPHVLAAGPATLHIIAGKDPESHLERYQDRVRLDFRQPGIEFEAFVSDPRIAYRRASVVIAPLLASAGTNIKIMEAMAMGRAIIATPAGINGLDELRDGHDVLVRQSGPEIATALLNAFDDPDLRRRLERNARVSAEQYYGWDAIATRQRDLWLRLIG